MLSVILGALNFVRVNLVPILISIGLAVFLFFVVGFFVVRGKLHDTEAELALAKTRLAQLEKDVKEITQTHVELARQVDNYKRKSDALAEKLERRGNRSISEMAKRHAKLVEKAINRGTEDALRCAEVISNGGDC
jgi:septal ring factor EnvC (AmiA/AmiB activator)